MKKILTFLSITLFCSLPAYAEVTPESCLDIHRSVGISMTRAMVKDFGIQEKELLINKTVMTLLEKNPVTEPLATLYAEQDYKSTATPFLSKRDYKAIYLNANPMNIIVRFDYVNKANKHNITLASLVVSEEECSISFNGYIIVKREF